MGRTAAFSIAVESGFTLRGHWASRQAFGNSCDSQKNLNPVTSEGKNLKLGCLNDKGVGLTSGSHV